MKVTKHFEYDDKLAKAVEVIDAGKTDIMYVWMGEFTIQINLNSKFEEVFKGEDYAVDMSKRVEDYAIFYGPRDNSF